MERTHDLRARPVCAYARESATRLRWVIARGLDFVTGKKSGRPARGGAHRDEIVRAAPVEAIRLDRAVLRA